MFDATSRRRQFLKSGGLLGAASLLGCKSKATALLAEQIKSSRIELPPEIKVIQSKEYGQKRIRQFQDGVKKAGLDAMILSNRCLDYVGYTSNYDPDSMEPAVVFIPAEGSDILFLQMYSSAHKRQAEKTIWIENIVDVPKDPVYETNSLNFYKEVANTLKDKKLTRGRIGFAGGEMDWILPYYFKDQFPGLHMEDANRVLWSLIEVKDEVELALMWFTARVSDEVAVPLIEKLLVPGTMDKEVFNKVLYAMMEAGSDSPMLILGASPYSAGIWATPPLYRRIAHGDIVLCEPIINTPGNYQTERMYTFAVGKPSDFPESQKRGAQVIYESYLIAFEAMKPGAELRAVYEKANNYIKSKGYPGGSTVLIGHFIGRNNHEGGRINSEGTEGVILKPGMVISWHPNVVVPGSGGVRTITSSCILITEKGPQRMSKLPLEPMVYV
ncbi:MAG TPA: M24 family metallopeptidase [Terriglobia bacterium]|nr:M24 family metallopeptidase [Terriglobia bacterium]